MNRILAGAGLAAIASFVTFQAVAAQPGGRVLPWDGAPSLQISVPGRVTITQGPTPRMVAYGAKADVDRLYLSGDRLRYRRDGIAWWGWRSPRRLRVEIVAPHLNNLEAHAGSNVDVAGLREEQLQVSVHSGADLHLNTSVKSLSAKVHSGGDFYAVGRAERLSLEVHSGGDARLGGLQVDHARISAHSGADATVNPRLSADATAHSGGDIRLVSRPAQLVVSRHSGGDVSVP